MTDTQLVRLAALAELVRERELAKLAALSERRRLCETGLKDSRDQKTRTIAAAAPDAAHFAGMDDTWLRWHARQIARLSKDAALAAADMEDQLGAARRAFGRAHALSRLAAQSKK